jgi:predicted nucleic acid-binding protein
MMSGFLIDTSCTIPLVSAWHEHHTRAHQAIEERLARGERLMVPGPGLIEAYAVLTRLPYPRRLSATAAGTLLTENFVGDDVEIISLDARTYARLVREAPHREIAGGTIYDAVILACALSVGASVLLTFNVRHFDRLATDSIEIVVPQ